MTDPQEPPKIIPPHGGYRDLQSYQMSEIVYDGTVVFCDRFISTRSRTHDQIVQAARSTMIFLRVRPLGRGATEFRITRNARIIRIHRIDRRNHEGGYNSGCGCPAA